MDRVSRAHDCRRTARTEPPAGPSARVSAALVAAIVVGGGGAALIAQAPAPGVRVAGAGLLAITVWLGVNDVARRLQASLAWRLAGDFVDVLGRFRASGGLFKAVALPAFVLTIASRLWIERIGALPEFRGHAAPRP